MFSYTILYDISLSTTMLPIYVLSPRVVFERKQIKSQKSGWCHAKTLKSIIFISTIFIFPLLSNFSVKNKFYSQTRPCAVVQFFISLSYPTVYDIHVLSSTLLTNLQGWILGCSDFVKGGPGFFNAKKPWDTVLQNFHSRITALSPELRSLFMETTQGPCLQKSDSIVLSDKQFFHNFNLAFIDDASSRITTSNSLQ
jgi:hypothetical protein